MKGLKKNKKELLKLARYIFEIKFKPNPIVLDSRGKWTSEVSKQFGFSNWSIDENKVEFINAKEKEKAYFSYRNIGYIIDEGKDIEDFINKSSYFIKYLVSSDRIGNNLHIERVGVRGIYCKQFYGTFIDLKRKFEENFVSLSDKAKQLLDIEVDDIGTILDLSDKTGNLHVMSGPMKEEQIRKYFVEQNTVPSVGLFFDVDYWKKPDAIVNSSSLSDMVKELALLGEKRFEQIENLIIGE